MNKTRSFKQVARRRRTFAQQDLQLLLADEGKNYALYIGTVHKWAHTNLVHSEQLKNLGRIKFWGQAITSGRIQNPSVLTRLLIQAIFNIFNIFSIFNILHENHYRTWTHAPICARSSQCDFKVCFSDHPSNPPPSMCNWPKHALRENRHRACTHAPILLLSMWCQSLLFWWTFKSGSFYAFGGSETKLQIGGKKNKKNKNNNICTTRPSAAFQQTKVERELSDPTPVLSVHLLAMINNNSMSTEGNTLSRKMRMRSRPLILQSKLPHLLLRTRLWRMMIMRQPYIILRKQLRRWRWGWDH